MNRRPFKRFLNRLVMPRAKKYLGQNFLIDPHVIDRIIDACELSKNEVVLEIGPGTGALTRRIAPCVGRLIAVETDRSLIAPLKEEFKGRNVDVIHADFLRLDLTDICDVKRPVKVMGNLPYYISTPILTKVIEERGHFTEFFLTVQKEFADRLTAFPGNKDYGSLTCFVQYYSRARQLFKIKNTCFKPVPKVDSCFLNLKLGIGPEHVCKDEKFLFEIIRLGFQQRRKTLANALSSAVPKDRLASVFEAMQLNAAVRAEQLSLKQFVLLSEQLSNV